MIIRATTSKSSERASRVALLVVAALAFAQPVQAEEVRQSKIGLPARIEGEVIEGPELEATPWDDRKLPVVVRIVATYPHGTAFRYDLEYTGFEAGDFDLRDYLRRKDGSSAETIPSLPVKFVSVLPAGQITPRELEAGKLPRVGGYRWLVAGLGTLWIVVLVALLWKRRRATSSSGAGGAHQPTLAERLRPMVDAAMHGNLQDGQRAELEQLLLGYWCKQLELEHLKPTQAIAQLREHAQAGPLLRQLEAWLHQPEPRQQVDVGELLKPYRDLPADEVAVSQSRTPSRQPLSEARH
jgi:hypothetical protein